MPSSNEIMYSNGRNDECFTPRYGVEPIVKYLDKGWTIWCPFDDENSEYVKVLEEAGFKVIRSCISTGQDFYEWDPSKIGESWDCIVSNPPFTNKRRIFERAMGFNKPFALLMSNTWLNDAAPKQVLGNKMELLMFDKRIKFMNKGAIRDKITFSSSYYCVGVLPRAIICEELKI